MGVSETQQPAAVEADWLSELQVPIPVEDLGEIFGHDGGHGSGPLSGLRRTLRFLARS